MKRSLFSPTEHQEMNPLRLVFTVCFVVSICSGFIFSGCGGDYSKDYLDSGDKVKLASALTVRMGPNIVAESCPGDLDFSQLCYRERYIYVVMPQSVPFVGSAEAVYDFSDLAGTEVDIAGPEILPCIGEYQLLRFHLPAMIKSVDSDKPILADFVGGVIDSASQEFRFNITTLKAGAFKIWFRGTDEPVTVLNQNYCKQVTATKEDIQFVVYK